MMWGTSFLRSTPRSADNVNHTSAKQSRNRTRRRGQAPHIAAERGILCEETCGFVRFRPHHRHLDETIPVRFGN
jgi:hypothetical protein